MIKAAAVRGLMMVCLAALMFGGGWTGADADGTVGLAPGHVDNSNPVTRAYFIRSVPPGGGFSDFVVVNNAGATPVDLFVNAVDGETGATSGAVYQNRVDPVVETGKWIVPTISTLTVPPRTRVNVPFTVRVPPDASAGDHLGGIAFEPQKGVTAGGNFAITTVVRSVIGVLVQVPGPAAFHMKIDGLEIQSLPATGTAAIVVHLQDDGLKLAKPRLSVTVDGPEGYHRTAPPPNCDPGPNRLFCGELDTILPGDAIPFAYPWPDRLADGDYSLSATGTWPGSSEKAVFTGTFHLGAALNGSPGGGLAGPPPRIVSRASSPPVIVIVAGSVLGSIVLMALIGMVILMVRRRRRRVHAREVVAVPPLRAPPRRRPPPSYLPPPTRRPPPPR